MKVKRYGYEPGQEYQFPRFSFWMRLKLFFFRIFRWAFKKKKVITKELPNLGVHSATYWTMAGHDIKAVLLDWKPVDSLSLPLTRLDYLSMARWLPCEKAESVNAIRLNTLQKIELRSTHKPWKKVSLCGDKKDTEGTDQQESETKPFSHSAGRMTSCLFDGKSILKDLDCPLEPPPGRIRDLVLYAAGVRGEVAVAVVRDISIDWYFWGVSVNDLFTEEVVDFSAGGILPFDMVLLIPPPTVAEAQSPPSCCAA